MSSVLSWLVIHLIIYLVAYFLITLYTVSVYSDVTLPICGYFGVGFPSDSYTYSATHSVLIFMLPFIKFVSSHTCSLCLFLSSLCTLCVLACLVWFSRIQGIFSICRFYFSVFLYCVYSTWQVFFHLAPYSGFCCCCPCESVDEEIPSHIESMARSTKRLYFYTAIYVERIIMTINLNLYWNKWNVKSNCSIVRKFHYATCLLCCVSLLYRARNLLC